MGPHHRPHHHALLVHALLLGRQVGVLDGAAPDAGEGARGAGKGVAAAAQPQVGVAGVEEDAEEDGKGVGVVGAVDRDACLVDLWDEALWRENITQIKLYRSTMKFQVRAFFARFLTHNTTHLILPW